MLTKNNLEAQNPRRDTSIPSVSAGLNISCQTEAEGQAMAELLGKCRKWSLASLQLLGDTGNTPANTGNTLNNTDNTPGNTGKHSWQHCSIG